MSFDFMNANKNMTFIVPLTVDELSLIKGILGQQQDEIGDNINEGMAMCERAESELTLEEIQSILDKLEKYK